MNLVLALRNLSRHRSRTLMTLAAIMLGVAALIVAGGFVQDIYEQLGDAIIHSQSGHLQIGRPALFAEGSRSPEKYLLNAPDKEKALVQAEDGVSFAMARLAFTGLLGNGSTELPVVGEGIEPGPESKLATSMIYVSGRALKDSDRYALVVGEGLAAALQLKTGDAASIVTPTIDGAMNTLEFEIVGIFQSFSKDYDMRAVKVPLAAAQELLATTGANTIVVLLHQTRATRAIAERIGPGLPGRQLTVKTWQELNDFFESTVQLYDRQFGVLNLIILVMVTLGVSTTVNMSVLERIGEFGTLRALGRRSSEVMQLVMTENALLGVIGASGGVLLGIAAAVAISAAGIPMPPPPNSNIGYIAAIRLVPSVIGMAFLIGVAATIIAAVFPAWRVARLPIAEALRGNV